MALIWQWTPAPSIPPPHPTPTPLHFYIPVPRVIRKEQQHYMPVCSLCCIAFQAIRTQRKEEANSPSRAKICGGFPLLADCTGSPAADRSLLFPISQESAHIKDVATYKMRNATIILWLTVEDSPEIKSVLRTSPECRFRAHKLGCRDPKVVYTGNAAPLLS